MTPRIQYLGGSEINWGLFLKETSDLKPLRGVDASGREFSDNARFIAALAEMQGCRNPLVALRTTTTLLRHVCYSFLVYSDQKLVNQVRERTDLTLTSIEADDDSRISVITGNVAQYRDGAVECCVENAPRNLRLLFDGFVIVLEKLGFEEVFSRYGKRQLTDKTFLLEYKP